MGISGWVGTVALAAGLTAGIVGQSASGASHVPANPDDRTIVHVLNRLGFGPAPGDIDRVRRIGLVAYIDQQLTPARLADDELRARLAPFASLSKTSRELAVEYFIPAQAARRERQQSPASGNDASTTADARNASATPRPEPDPAITNERHALAELMQAKILRAAYSERQLEEVMAEFWFNHFNVFSGKGLVRQYLHQYERDAIRPHVLGKFRDLLAATAESPAMLMYLDNWQSAAPSGRARPDSLNRRRGLNENYARELMELHTLGVDGGYTQKDVQEVARAFTGWTIATPRQGGAFRFEPRMHDFGEKVVLGHKIRAGGGKKDGDEVISLLAKHPSTAKFISSKLARRFVADDPPTALVDRVARTFRESDGDIREVVRAIITSPEFFAPAAHRAKVKTPFEFVVSAVRALGLDVTKAQPLVVAVRTLGMPIYGCQPPTGYGDRAEAWVNSGALLNRMNFAVQLTSPRPRTGQRSSATSDILIKDALAGELSKDTVATVATPASPPQKLALVLGSPEFQRK